MELFPLDTIRKRLDDEFLPLEPTLTGFRLIESPVSPDVVLQCARRLDVAFPSSFADAASHFDFGRFTIGPVAFCNTGDYFAWLVKVNENTSSHAHPWWGEAQRPHDLIMIANSDPYAILLNVNTGQVLALLHGDVWAKGAFVVARDFDVFFRGLATVLLQRRPGGENEGLARKVAAAVGVEPENAFWLEVGR
ncbi:MAG: hypothetical protein U0793_21665 [Gemmataceae bacterium]